MEYYVDNEFDDYIEVYKNQIKKLWENYIPNNQHEDEEIQNDKKPSALAAHMQKKHSHNELEVFLNSSTINFDSNILDFWKVKNQIYNINTQNLLNIYHNLF
jgi:hypothetical protein